MEDTLVPIIAIMMTFGAPAVILWQFFTSRHKERMTIIERGLDPEQYKVLYARNAMSSHPLNTLKWALIFTFGGAGLLLGSWMQQVYRFPDETVAAMPLLGAGIGMMIYYMVARKKS